MNQSVQVFPVRRGNVFQVKQLHLVRRGIVLTRKKMRIGRNSNPSFGQ